MAGFKLDIWSANHQTLIPSSLKKGHQINDSVYINLQNVVKTLVLVIGKIFLQDLWLAKINWDDELVDKHRSSWLKYQNSLTDLNAIRIDRWLTMRARSMAEIHGFSDSSSRAYAATVYVRITSEKGTVHVNLLAVKTKVSPVKTVSIPNIKLCGATLLVRLIKNVQRLDFLKPVPVIAWSDSQVVLVWIKQHPSRWKQFVANRVSTIQTELPNARWQYVPTKSNPADLATRGMSPKELSESNLWWHGPFWLSQSPNQWPRQEKNTNSLEEHAQVNLVHRTPLDTGNDKDNFINRFFNLNRTVQVVAWCLRYVTNYRRRKQREQKEMSFITVSELSKARIALIKLTQRIEFSNDIVAVRNNQQLPRNSPLKRLNPYLDDEGVLRVMGRLRHSSVLYDTKYPPILPKNSHLAQLYVRHAHQDCWHGGTALTLSTLRTQVWVVGGLKLVKYTVRNCVKCARYRSQPVTQRMGDLPSSQVNLERPFSETDVDYASPILVRRNAGRGQASCKGYIALFVCMATKAVHLEAVGHLTTEAFLNAYRRFAGRRRVCRKLYSDNGTNFRGADTELRNLFQEYSDFYQTATQHFATRSTEWSFIPPRAPHFGGLWEAGVKFMKRHLIKVIGDYKLTYEELSTVLTQIEACINSRPLCPLTDEPDDLAVLTPAHFLTGGTSALIFEPEPPNLPENRLTRYQLLQRMKLHYWKRWSTDYLTTLQQRVKWERRQKNLEIGQLVVVKKDGLPPAKWIIGRVMKLHPGADKEVRVVTIHTPTTTMEHPIVKVVPLLSDTTADAPI
ncbi:uncharacterized protein [Cardiocondyla obscurior]|uniref:uncharacterized protein n=1 Tax=Cardiocondyla obscurior TaxID=286306 RepID=UPI0039655EE0